MYNKWLLLLVWATVAHAADVCNPLNLSGPYAFQLAGTTTISGAPQPAASLGRLVFEGGGKVSGTSSVMFSGLLLGNPVTGSYEAKPDCTVTWQLQDDSGGFQHFSGKMSSDGTRVEFRQADNGGIAGGVMEKTSDSCTQADVQRRYTFTLLGQIKAMQPGQSERNASGRGSIDATREGNFQVDSDCTVHFVLKLPGGEPELNMRGFVVNGGREILAFQTDPGAMVSVRLKEAAK
jgi:hypothetical protein